MQKELELKYKDKYAILNSKYQVEIEELHNTIRNIEKIVVENN